MCNIHCLHGLIAEVNTLDMHNYTGERSILQYLQHLATVLSLCVPVDPLAIRYNDQSPLENHHCAAAAALLFQEQYQYIQVSTQTMIHK